jgi:hypothetical protein
MSNIITLNNALAVQEIQQLSANESAAWQSILKTNQNGKTINNAGTVHYDDYKDLTTDVVKAREFMNVGIQDLIGNGLTQASTINKTIVQYQTMNTFDADVSMNGSNQTENQTTYAENWLPQPIYTSQFFIPWREEGFSYKQSDGVQESVYRVNELQDRVLFLGADLGVKISGADAPLYGYNNHPDTITSTISDWTLTTEIGLNAIAPEAVGLVGELFVGGRVMEPNSVMMYVATDIWSNLQNDYASAKGDRTILERINAISEIGGVKPQKDMPSGTVTLVEMRQRTVQLSVAQMPIAVPHVKSHQLENGQFTIYSSMVAKIKADRTGKAGIVYATPA